MQGYSIGNRYQIIDIIGKGGMATVYRGRESGLNRDVAIKVMASHLADNPDYADRFDREAQTIATLQHPSIIQIHYYGVDAIGSYVVMPLLRGGTLIQRMQQAKQLISLHEVADIGHKIGSALHHAHQNNVIHRDIKFSNIMFDASGHPYVMDFGIARMINSTQLTATGGYVGTPQFMAPEQWRGEMSPAVDQYALAVVLYELLSGQPPFVGDTAHALMYQHLETTPPPLSHHRQGLPESVDEVFERALAKQPTARYPSILHFAEALKGAAQEIPPQETGFFTIALDLPAPQPIQQTPAFVAASNQQTPAMNTPAPPIGTSIPSPVSQVTEPANTRTWLTSVVTIAVVLIISVITILYIQNSNNSVSMQLTAVVRDASAAQTAAAPTVTRIIPTNTTEPTLAAVAVNTEAIIPTETETASPTATNTATATETTSPTATNTATALPTEIVVTPLLVQNAEIVVAEASIYSEPRQNAPVLASLGGGRSVEIIGQHVSSSQRWYQIVLENGQVGYVLSPNISLGVATETPIPDYVIEPLAGVSGRIRTNNTFLRSDPFASSGQITLMNANTIVLVTGQVDVNQQIWFQVRLSNGISGFVNETQIVVEFPDESRATDAPDYAVVPLAGMSGRIRTNNTSLRSEPFASSETVEMLSANTTLLITGQTVLNGQTWFQVSLADGTSGFVNETQIQIFDDVDPTATPTPTSVGASSAPAVNTEPCEVQTTGDVAVHVGPGLNRGIRGSMSNGWIEVSGQAIDNRDIAWWRLIILGAAQAEENRYWVQQDDVRSRGNCAGVAFVEGSAFVRAQVQNTAVPDTGSQSGGGNAAPIIVSAYTTGNCGDHTYVVEWSDANGNATRVDAYSAQTRNTFASQSVSGSSGTTGFGSYVCNTPSCGLDFVVFDSNGAESAQVLANIQCN